MPLLVMSLSCILGLLRSASSVEFCYGGFDEGGINSEIERAETVGSRIGASTSAGTSRAAL